MKFYLITWVIITRNKTKFFHSVIITSLLNTGSGVDTHYTFTSHNPHESDTQHNWRAVIYELNCFCVQQACFIIITVTFCSGSVKLHAEKYAKEWKKKQLTNFNELKAKKAFDSVRHSFSDSTTHQTLH